MEGNMNNYKGVMLCSRPNEQVKAPIEKPFCSRVEGAPCLGLCPIKKQKFKKEINVALQRHKDWLNMFKLKMVLKKEEEDEQKVRDEEKFERVKELAQKDRIRTKKMKSEFQKLNQNIDNILAINNEDEIQQDEVKQPEKLIQQNLQELNKQNDVPEKKINENNKQKEDKSALKKPKWALTQEQQENNEDKECDELLDFVNNLDYDQYINDLEVQSMIKAIKSRITELQEKKNWKENAIEDYRNKKQKNKENNQQQDDLKSNISQNSQCPSVQSEKTQQAINTLKQQLIEEKKDWDKSTTGDKNYVASIEEKIAKHVADEVLRNYKHLASIHSNQSIRKLLEKEASNFINKGSVNPPLIAINKETTLRKNEVDPNNLPYLHRNPAV